MDDFEPVRVSEVVVLTPTISQGFGTRADGSPCVFYGDARLMALLAERIAEGEEPEAMVPVVMIRTP